MEQEINITEHFDFYDQTYLKTYNLNNSIRYQLNLLDSLDMFTRKHSENVATLTCNLCKKLHCSKGFTEYCVTCAYIHDIGKMFISQKILQKKGILTNEEFEIMKTHTTLGYQLCLKDKALIPYYAGPYYHHEALDGTGYPQGLVKKDIPYESQIIRVADEFDALVSKRQYKSHINISDALNLIIENTHPSPNAPEGTGYTDAGKNNKLVVKKLISVVLDDTQYEIACTMNYIKYLKEQIARFDDISKLIKKMNSSTKQVDIDFYKDYIPNLLKNNESLENFDQIRQEYIDTYNSKQQTIKDLFVEIKKIKKLKV